MWRRMSAATTMGFARAKRGQKAGGEAGGGEAKESERTKSRRRVKKQQDKTYTLTHKYYTMESVLSKWRCANEHTQKAKAANPSTEHSRSLYIYDYVQDTLTFIFYVLRHTVY